MQRACVRAIGRGAAVSRARPVLSGARPRLSETGGCQRRHCFLLLTGLDHCSYENCALPGFPRPALISMSLTHVHLRVSDMRIMLRTYGAVAFDPERQREAPRHPRGGCSTPTGGRKFFAGLICIAINSRGAESNALPLRDRQHFGVCLSACDRFFERLTREEGAQGRARRCSVPGYVCRRLAREDGKWGRTVEQLCERGKRRNISHFFLYTLRDLKFF